MKLKVLLTVAICLVLSACKLPSAKGTSSLTATTATASSSSISHNTGNQPPAKTSGEAPAVPSAVANFANSLNTPVGKSLLSEIVSHPVVGYIDGIFPDGNGVSVDGWACALGSPQSIQVHLYLGGPVGVTGSFLTAANANIANSAGEQPALSAACNSTGTAYRFRIPISSDQLSSHSGQSIFVYGINPFGEANLSVSRSGDYFLPTTSEPPRLIQVPDALHVSASASFVEHIPFKAVDSDVDSFWNAGAYAPQQIQLDLGGQYDLDRLELITGQDPMGFTVHEIWGGSDPQNLGDLHLIYTAQGPTQDRQVILAKPLQQARGIRTVIIKTTQSPSWVAWRDIKVFGTLSNRIDLKKTASFSASSTFEKDLPGLVADGDPASFWNSGGPPGGWLQIDLNGIYDLSRIRLLTGQSWPEQTVHEVWGGLSSDPSQMRLLGTLSGLTVDQQWLTVAAPTHFYQVRYLRVKTLQSNDWVAWREVQVFGTPSVQNAIAPHELCDLASHMPAFYGYFAGDDPDGSGNTGNRNWNHMASNSDKSNLTYMQSTDPALAAKLSQAATRGMGVVVNLGWEKNQSIVATGTPVEMDQVWARVSPIIQPYLSNVVAIVITDEPDITQSQVMTNLEYFAKIMKRDFPQLIIMEDFDGHVLDLLDPAKHLHLPKGVDWFGFDSYMGYEDSGWDFKTKIGDVVPRLEALLNPSQKILLVPDATLLAPDENSVKQSAKNKLVGIIDQYFQLATTDPKVVMAIPFLWNNWQENQLWVGAGSPSMQEIAAEHAKFSRCVKFRGM